MQRSVSYLCYAYYYDWQANSRRKSFCLSSFHDPLPAKRCETTAIITIVPCHALCQQRFPSATGQLPSSPQPSASLCCLQSLPALFIHSFVHHFQLHPPFSSARRIVRARRALLARRLLWWPFVATPVFTHLHLHLHFASIISMPRLMLKALWHQQQQQQQQRGVETAAQKALPTLRRI